MRVRTVRDPHAEFFHPKEVSRQPEPDLDASPGLLGPSQAIVEGAPVVPADPDDAEPNQPREKRWHTRLTHPSYRVLYDACPKCGFPEAEGGYCPECGWTLPVKTGVYVL